MQLVGGMAMAAYAEFELDLTRALLQYLPPVLEALAPAPLTQIEVASLPEKAQGVYMLLFGGIPTYIGKTDAEHGFQTRLQRHLYTLSARQNLDIADITYRAVRIMVFTTVNVESTLIKHFHVDANPMAWQNSGFGSNDPGHRREGQEPSVFDVQYPINIDLPLPFVVPATSSVRDLLVLLKQRLPFDLRYQTDHPQGARRPQKHTVGHEDQRSAVAVVPRPAMSLRQLLCEVILPSLPPGWSATVFPGRVILYKEPTLWPHAIERLTA
jgi:hypothetical protein